MSVAAAPYQKQAFAFLVVTLVVAAGAPELGGRYPSAQTVVQGHGWAFKWLMQIVPNGTTE